MEEPIQAPARTPAGYDLLQHRPLRWLVRLRIFPGLFQVMMLGAMIALAIIGWRVYGPKGVPDKVFAKNNLVTLLIWGLWWPAAVWATVLLGRVWCLICPLEWVSTRFERLAGRLGIGARRLPQWLRAGWIILGLFAVAQLLVAGVHLHRSPAYTSIMVWSLLLLAALAGLFFRNRAFCRAFCPAAQLLAVYGRGGIFAVRPKPGAEGSGQAGASCPTLLNPPTLSHSRDCLMCMQCVKECEGEMTLYARRPNAEADHREEKASWPVTLFVMAVSGFVTSEVCSESAVATDVFKWVPASLAEALSAGAWGTWIEGAWTIIIVPLVIWGFLGSLIHFFGCGAPIGAAWRRLAYPMAIIVAAGHMAKGLAKVATWIGHVPLAMHDPTGAATATALSAKTMAAPAAALSMPWVAGISLAVLAIGLLVALREARLTPGLHAACMSVAVGNLAAMYAVVIVMWARQPFTVALIAAAGVVMLISTVAILGGLRRPPGAAHSHG